MSLIGGLTLCFGPIMTILGSAVDNDIGSCFLMLCKTAHGYTCEIIIGIAEVKLVLCLTPLSSVSFHNTGHHALQKYMINKSSFL